MAVGDLPARLSSFVGRESELVDLTANPSTLGRAGADQREQRGVIPGDRWTDNKALLECVYLD